MHKDHNIVERGTKKLLGFFFGKEGERSSDHPAQSPSASHHHALERFMMHVHRGDSVGSNDGGDPHQQQQQPTSPPPSSVRLHHDRQEHESLIDDFSTTRLEDLETQKREGLLQTYHSVPYQVVLSQAEVSLASLERISTYMEERWKLENRYAKERSRLRLDLRLGAHPDDGLENCIQAIALFQDVETTQVSALVEDFDQDVRIPLLKLREELANIVGDCRNEMNRIEKESDSLERRLAKSKQGIQKLRDKRNELAHRIDQYRRVVASDLSSSAGGGSSSGSLATGAAAAVDMYDPERFPTTPIFDDQPSPNLEINIIPSLEKRLYEVEGEIRTALAGVETQAMLLLEAMKRQDEGVKRCCDVLQHSENARRAILHRSATAYAHSQARNTQQNLMHLDRMTRMLAEVEAERDVQRFISQHGTLTGTPLRSMALKLLALRDQPSRSSSHHRGGRGGGNKTPHSKQKAQPAQQQQHQRQRTEGGLLSLSPTSPLKGKSAGEEGPGQEIRRGDSSSSASSSTTRDEDLGGGWYHVHEEDVFDEKEDPPVIAALLHQLFRKEEIANNATPPVAPPPPSFSSAILGRAETYDWDRLALTKSSSHLREEEKGREGDQNGEEEGEEGEERSGVIPSSLHSTGQERARFFERIFSGEDGRGRAAFLHELNQQRSKETEVGLEGFEQLSDLMWQLLIHCQRRHDFQSSTMAMMLSQTFYHFLSKEGKQGDSRQDHQTTTGGKGEGDEASVVKEQEKGEPSPQPVLKEAKERAERVYLSTRLLGHPLWADYSFWENALFQCVAEQMPTIDLPSDDWHDLSPKARDELVHRVHNIIFSQTGALCHSMIEFGGCFRFDEAVDFVSRVAEQHGLPETMKLMLLKHLYQSRKEIEEEQGKGGKA